MSKPFSSFLAVSCALCSQEAKVWKEKAGEGWMGRVE